MEGNIDNPFKLLADINIVEIVAANTPAYFAGVLTRTQKSLQRRLQVEKGNKLVLEQIVTTIASVADTAEEKFKDYYDR
jgi:hypothetical protein